MWYPCLLPFSCTRDPGARLVLVYPCSKVSALTNEDLADKAETALQYPSNKEITVQFFDTNLPKSFRVIFLLKTVGIFRL
jgi:hypothetical protein